MPLVACDQIYFGVRHHELTAHPEQLAVLKQAAVLDLLNRIDLFVLLRIQDHGEPQSPEKHEEVLALSTVLLNLDKLSKLFKFVQGTVGSLEKSI